MIFTLLFILSLTAVVVFASLMVWKSEYSQREKRVLIAILFALLSLVIIVNEAKNQNYITFSLLGLHETDYSQNFFNISELQDSLLQPRFTLFPMSYKHTSDIIKNNFGTIDLMPEQLKNTFFYLAISEENSGASHTLKHYARSLQQNNMPVLYTRLTKIIKSQQDLENILQIQGLDRLQKTVGNMNKRSLIPFLIIDNYHYAFNEGKDKDNFSLISHMLLDIYFKYQVKIILHTHIKKVATQIMQGIVFLFLFLNIYQVFCIYQYFTVPRVYQVLDLIRYSSIQPIYAFEYIVEHYSETTKGIRLDQLQKIDDWIGLDYEIVSKYTQNFEKLHGDEQKLILQKRKSILQIIKEYYNDSKDHFNKIKIIMNLNNLLFPQLIAFIKQVLQEYQTIVNKDSELKDILYMTKSTLGLKDKVKSSHKIISFSELKNQGLYNIADSLFKYEQSGVMWIEQGYISFSKRYFNSIFI